MKTYRALSALLTYPEAEMVAAADEIGEVLLAEGLLPLAARRAVEVLLRELRAADLMDLQERYVGLFDRTPSLSLHLFGHVHGDSRDRGQAMVDLIELYRRHGVEIAANNELPDYLPLFLEFLSEVSPEEAATMLRDVAPVVAPIQARLAKRGSAYAGVLGAILTLAGVEPLAVETLPETDEDSPAAIDKAWEDREVRFGDGTPETAGACSKAAAMVRRMETLQTGGQ